LNSTTTTTGTPSFAPKYGPSSFGLLGVTIAIGFWVL
jgi:hypothetical protein